MRTWLRSLSRVFQGRKAGSAPRKQRLQLETLEDRCVPAGFLSGQPIDVMAFEGDSFSGPVAVFTDSDPASQAGDYTVTIDWGDDTEPSGGVVTNNSGGGYLVTGMHQYLDDGTYPVDIVIQDKDGTNLRILSDAVIADGFIFATGIAISAVQGETVTKPVARFTTTDPNASPGDFTATIEWGDGHVSSGTISVNPGPQGGFLVTGTNTYLEPGFYTLTITINSTGGSSATTHSTAIVSEADLFVTGLPVETEEGVEFTAAVGRVTSADPQARAEDFMATIDWGDGQVTSGTVVDRLGGGFDVIGSHTYAQDGTYTIHITVQDATNTAMADTTATVTDSGLVGQGIDVTVPQGRAANNVPVATFTDTGGPEPVGNYTASIDWGDGTAVSQGVITLDGGTFTVTASHTFASPGRFTVRTTIRSAGGATLAVESQATVGSLNERFVASLYRDLLGRRPDPGGLSHFTALLQQGVSRAQIARIIQDSLEYRIRVVRGLYRQFLGRDADSFGLNIFVSFLGSGGTITQLRAILIGSPEYWARAGGTINGFLTAVYRDVLGRDVDPLGRQFFGQLLRAGVPRTSVALLILTSNEATLRQVRGFYRTYLGREADPRGLNNFASRLQRGEREQNIIADMLGSAEYFQRV